MQLIDVLGQTDAVVAGAEAREYDFEGRLEEEDSGEGVGEEGVREGIGGDVE